MNDCFLDTNILIYLVDESSLFYQKAKELMLKFEKNNVSLYISHLILAEFIHVFSSLLRLAKEENIYTGLQIVLKKIKLIQNVLIVSPPEDFMFADSVLGIMKKYKLKSNDAYILSTIKYRDISYLASFDNKLIQVAKKLKIKIA